MVTATAGKNTSIVVSNSDGSTNLVRLNLVPGTWVEDPITPTLPPQPQGAITYASRPPEFGAVLAQIDGAPQGFERLRVQTLFLEQLPHQGPGPGETGSQFDGGLAGFGCVAHTPLPVPQPLQVQ